MSASFLVYPDHRLFAWYDAVCKTASGVRQQP